MAPEMIRLPGPTPGEIEEDVAEYIEQTLVQYYDRDLGPRTRRDATDESGLRVDFTYDEAEPPAAMEVTTLVTPTVMALNSELAKLEDRLGEIVGSEDLGSWLLGILVGASPYRLEDPLVELMRSQKSRTERARYTIQEAPYDLADEHLALIANLLDLGLFFAERADGEPGVSIFPPVSDGPEVVSGFATLLRAAMAANVEKLREAKPRETHLGVAVSRPVSADPAHTPPPSLPDGIDSLWVILSYYNAKFTHRLWRAIHGEKRWHLLRHPLGEPIAFNPPSTTADG